MKNICYFLLITFVVTPWSKEEGILIDESSNIENLQYTKSEKSSDIEAGTFELNASQDEIMSVINQAKEEIPSPNYYISIAVNTDLNTGVLSYVPTDEPLGIIVKWSCEDPASDGCTNVVNALMNAGCDVWANGNNYTADCP